MNEAPARVFALEHPSGLRIEVTDAGAAWMSCLVPLKDGARRQVLLGYGDPMQYFGGQFGGRGYLGATVGRYANRIAGASYVHERRTVQLAPNEGSHTLHGGPQGFSHRRWQVAQQQLRHIEFTLHSPDGDQGFPGEVHARVRYALDDDAAVSIDLDADVSRATPLALTNHAYLNLDAQHIDCRGHRLCLRAGHYVPVDAQRIPTGPLDPVAADFDFRRARAIGTEFLASEQQRLADGYDHAFLLDESCRVGEQAAAEIESADGCLRALLYTNQRALQFYSGNFLDQVTGRDGRRYARHAGLALEPGVPPDSPNRPQWHPWSDCFAQPGTHWHASIRWQFQAA